MGNGPDILIQWTSVLLIACLLNCSGGPSTSQLESGSAKVRAVIASQVASQFGVWQVGSGTPVDPADIELEPGPRVVPGIHVIRGFPPTSDRGLEYLVAIRGKKLCVAGGFTSPEMACIARSLRETESFHGVVGISQALAILADQNGAMRVFPAAAAETPLQQSASDAWNRHRPESWPRDTILRANQGMQTVRVTMLSQEIRTYAQFWRAFAYDFRFDSHGRFVAWSTRKSEPFSLH